MARSAQCSSVIASVAPFACTISTARCAASTALSVVAPFTEASSNQLRAVQPASDAAASFPRRLGRAIGLKAFVHAETHVSPADHPASRARSQGATLPPSQGQSSGHQARLHVSHTGRCDRRRRLTESCPPQRVPLIGCPLDAGSRTGYVGRSSATPRLTTTHTQQHSHAATRTTTVLAAPALSRCGPDAGGCGRCCSVAAVLSPVPLITILGSTREAGVSPTQKPIRPPLVGVVGLPGSSCIPRPGKARQHDPQTSPASAGLFSEVPAGARGFAFAVDQPRNIEREAEAFRHQKQSQSTEGAPVSGEYGIKMAPIAALGDLGGSGGQPGPCLLGKRPIIIGPPVSICQCHRSSEATETPRCVSTTTSKILRKSLYRLPADF